MRICQSIGVSTLIMSDEQNAPPHIHMHTHICACVLSCFSRVQLFATLWIMAHMVPLSMGFPGQEDQSGLPCPPPGDLPDPGIHALLQGIFLTQGSNLRLLFLCLPHWQAGSLTLAPSRKPEIYIYIISIRKIWSYIYSVDWTIRIMKVSIFWQWKSAWHIVERKKVHNSNFV